MKTPVEIAAEMELMTAYVARAKQQLTTCGDFDEATRTLRKIYDWNIRIEMLEWVLTPTTFMQAYVREMNKDKDSGTRRKAKL
jgi:hypothetical protein